MRPAPNTPWSKAEHDEEVIQLRDRIEELEDEKASARFWLTMAAFIALALLAHTVATWML